MIDTEARPMREVIARCGTIGHARRIAGAMNAEREAEPLRERMKTLYADLCSPGPIDAERQRTLATLAEQALTRVAFDRGAVMTDQNDPAQVGRIVGCYGVVWIEGIGDGWHTEPGWVGPLKAWHARRYAKRYGIELIDAAFDEGQR